MAKKSYEKPTVGHAEEIEKLKEEYKKLQEKYKQLPGFDALDEEFEIRKIDTDLFLIREIRRQIMQRLEFCVVVLEPILNPSPSSLHSYIETKIFAKHNIEPMFEFYKRVWHIMHQAIHASYLDEKAEAEWVIEAWKAWPKIKKESAEYTKLLADGWARVEKEIFQDKYLQ